MNNSPNENKSGSQETYYALCQDTFPIGGQSAVELQAPYHEGQSTPSIVNATILPGYGMNVFQITAYLPGLGLFNMLTSLPLDEAATYLKEEPFGNRSFMVGGAMLIPFAGRIRGTLCADGKSISINIQGNQVTLPANWSSNGNTGGEKVAMHGLILDRPMDSIKTGSDEDTAFVEAKLLAHDYGIKWPGSAEHTFRYSLKESAFYISITTRNVGDTELPFSIGWHPYFTFPSKSRESIKLHIHSQDRAELNNYGDVFPTGTLLPLENSPFDFGSNSGQELGTLFLDDCFTNLKRDEKNNCRTTLYDSKYNYGVDITANDSVKAFQVFAPVDQPFVAIEPQMNLPDPFNNNIWNDRDTGMIFLKPGEFKTYTVKVALFQK